MLDCVEVELIVLEFPSASKWKRSPHLYVGTCSYMSMLSEIEIEIKRERVREMPLSKAACGTGMRRVFGLLRSYSGLART